MEPAPGSEAGFFFCKVDPFRSYSVKVDCRFRTVAFGHSSKGKERAFRSIYHLLSTELRPGTAHGGSTYFF